MRRKVFFSFHFNRDFWRTQQVRNINALEGQVLCPSNDWEMVKRRGTDAIRNWIDQQMYGKSCVVVLVGSETASRPWVRYEISKAWADRRGVLGIRIDRLLDVAGEHSAPGTNPFSLISINPYQTLEYIAPLKSPTHLSSKDVYAWIANGIELWIDEAIEIRKRNIVV